MAAISVISNLKRKTGEKPVSAIVKSMKRIERKSMKWRSGSEMCEMKASNQGEEVINLVAWQAAMLLLWRHQRKLKAAKKPIGGAACREIVKKYWQPMAAYLAKG
jgi:hypothetical protein